METFLKNIIGGEKVLEFWKELAQKLPKKESVFQVSDFDYTLFSRDEQFEKIPELLEYRADKGPKFLFENYGMIRFLDECYRGYSLPREILDRLDSKRDIIITAGGSKDFQLAKIRTCPELNDFRVITTFDGLEKIPELIRYVIFELRYIPSEIIIYEDRPQYFLEYRELIE